MTTLHTNEPLVEVFWFSKHCAIHPTVELENKMLLHISVQNKGQEFLTAYAKA
jgi:hypothetical protein